MPFQGGRWQDRSGTITEGGVSQLLMGASQRRLGFFVQNLSLQPLWINWEDEATTGLGSLRIGPYGFYEEATPGNVSDQAIYIIGSVTGQQFTAKEM